MFYATFPPEGFPLQLDYSQIIWRDVRNDSGYPERLFLTHECIYRSNGAVNMPNGRFWGLESRRAVEKVPITSEKVMWWCRMHKTKKIGPYFFSKPTVNGKNYQSMSHSYTKSKISDLPGYLTFQQNGPSQNWDVHMRRYLDTKLSQRGIERGGPTACLTGHQTRLLRTSLCEAMYSFLCSRFVSHTLSCERKN